MTASPRIIGVSPLIVELRRLIRCVAPSQMSVLIVGERGTGKELVAKAMHGQSRRADRPLVTVNCAALGTELLTTELFGHERGAFTGAVQRRVGLLVSADGGTLFLDEVGDLAPAAQGMLLRVLEEREVRPVGADATRPVDVRILAATNKDLKSAIERGEFRADLYDRLSEVVIETVPLRRRLEDILVLAAYFARLHTRRHRVRVRGFTAAALDALRAYAWPGNVRELEKTISRAVVFASGRRIVPEDLQLDTTLRRSAAEDPRGCGIAADPLVRETAVQLAMRQGRVRRRDLVEGLGISDHRAEQALAALVRAGALRRLGRRGGVRYASARG